jgi:hypothetical protein
VATGQSGIYSGGTEFESEDRKLDMSGHCSEIGLGLNIHRPFDR